MFSHRMGESLRVNDHHKEAINQFHQRHPMQAAVSMPSTSSRAHEEGLIRLHFFLDGIRLHQRFDFVLLVCLMWPIQRMRRTCPEASIGYQLTTGVM
jgi:hypothetical protein